MKRCSTLLAILSVLLAGSALAQVPQTMSYQGVLTDNLGAVVPDGFYDLTFRVYNVPVAGSALWTEAHTGVNHVQVSKGGFSVILGSLSALTLPFDGPYYLGVQIAVDPELSPRIPLASSPYALGLRLPFTLSTVAGTPLLQAYDFGGLGAAFDFYSPGGAYTYDLEPDGNGSGGWFWVSGGTSGGFNIDGNYGGLGSPALTLAGLSSFVFINTNGSGDGSVQLPADAVSAGEILDEPGVAQGHVNGSVIVPIGGTMGDIVTVTINTPAAGYIVVEADGQNGIGGSGTATLNYASYQIDETAGGGTDGSHYFDSGFSVGAAGARNFFTWSPVSIRRTYFKAAGTYTFRLEAFGVQNEVLQNYFWNPTITATFYPTGYGTVTTAPPVAELSEFSSVQQTSSAGNGPGGAPVQGQLVDLRELELRAAQATAEAERAQRTLVEAQMAAQAKVRAQAKAAPVGKAGN
jgi:hypothetical protein